MSNPLTQMASALADSLKQTGKTFEPGGLFNVLHEALDQMELQTASELAIASRELRDALQRMETVLRRTGEHFEAKHADKDN